jgi:hypothetical protein
MLLVRLLILGNLLISSNLLACDKPSEPIYCAIKTISPETDSAFALKLSNLIYKYSKKYGTNPYISVAIIAQESMFQNINRKQDILIISEECEEEACVESVKTVKGYTDIGIYQFHLGTIKAYGMDALRLKNDLEYATDRHMFLLKEKLRECADLGDAAYTCYHSRSPRQREAYLKLVTRYLERIKNANVSH